MGLKQIIQNFSFETLANLPPSELLALIALISVVVYLAANLVFRLSKNS
jgi:hypothetical protein